MLQMRLKIYDAFLIKIRRTRSMNSIWLVGFTLIFRMRTTPKNCYLFCFISDYHNSRCQSFSINTDTKGGRAKLQPDSGVNFYEKLCLRGVKQSRFDNLCQAERGWAFERVVGGLLEGFNHKEINNIETRGECARLCLLEDDFPCRYSDGNHFISCLWNIFLRSAEYNSDNRRCILSRDDRRTQPEAFRFGAG